MKILREIFLYELKEFLKDLNYSDFNFESSFKFSKFLISFFSEYNEKLIEEDREIEISSKYGHWDSIINSYKSIPLDDYFNLVEDCFKLIPKESKNSTNRRNSETHQETPEKPNESTKEKQIVEQIEEQSE